MLIPVATKASRSFIVGKGGSYALVDSGMEDGFDAVAAALAAAGIAPEEIRLIVLTHAHADHSGGLRAARAATGAKLLAHALEAVAVETGKGAEIVGRGVIAGLTERLVAKLLENSGSAPCPVDIRMDAEIRFEEIGITVVPTPGHTRGSLSVLIDAETQDASGGSGDGSGGREAIVGDLFRGKPGKLRLGPFVSDIEASLASVKALLDAGMTRFHPMHGECVDREDVETLLQREKGRRQSPALPH